MIIGILSSVEKLVKNLNVCNVLAVIFLRHRYIDCVYSVMYCVHRGTAEKQYYCLPLQKKYVKERLKVIVIAFLEPWHLCHGVTIHVC